MPAKTAAVSSPERSGALPDPRWARVLARDAAADGQFVYGVKTTGVYCRPSCPSRRPRPENVVFFADGDAARRAGFRPCLRCQPDQPSLAARHAEVVARVCRLLEEAEQLPSLAALAQAVQLSPHHLHRMFKAQMGISPRAYGVALRARRVQEALLQGAGVTQALHDAGYGSSGRFYAAAEGVLGMTPGAFRAGGARAQIRFAVGQCSLGAILVAASERGVCAILLGDAPEVLVQDLQDRFPRAELLGGDAAFETLVATVVGFVEQPGRGLDLPLDIRGTAFQQRVWQALREIPAGTTLSYTELAQRIGAPRAVRAVAGACAANALAVAIPCHRIVRSDGGLSGYRWGVARKQALLTREAACRAPEPEDQAGASGV